MRRRRQEHLDDTVERRRASAQHARQPAYQDDPRAGDAGRAYDRYEIYEEYEDTPARVPPAHPRATVVMPAVTLPSVPAARAPAAPPFAAPFAAPHGPRAGDVWPATGGQSPRTQSGRSGEDDRWPTGQTVAPRRRVAAQPLRTTIAPAAVDDDEISELDWSEAPTGAWGASGFVGRQPSVDGPAATRTSLAPRPLTPHHRLTQAEMVAASAAPARAGGRIRRLNQPMADAVFIPARRRALPPSVRVALARLGDAIAAVARRPALASAVVLATLLMGFLLDVTGAAQQAGAFSASAWQAVGGTLPSTNSVVGGAITAPPNYDAQHYMDKYGFFRPGPATPLSSDESARLVQMAPAAIRAAQAYDKRYNKSIEPQMLLYWTHSEGIRGRVNYSNCANEDTPAGTTYFSYIANCDHASFWQLGYGNQFGLIYVLRNAFTDLYGDPNDTQLVAKVGQGVLDFDKSMGTTPPCGGYSCAFPAKTIDAILSGVNLRTGVQAEDNWWASVLSRDPAINCYMIAHALTFFSHEATRNWVGCYYAAPCWQRNSDRLGDILAAWPNLVKAAGVQS